MFESIAFLILWGFILFLSWLLLRACNLSLSIPSIPSILYIFYISFNYLGIPLLYFFMVSHLYNYGIQDRETIWFLWLNTSICLLLLLTGFLYTNKIIKLSPEKFKTHSCENQGVTNFDITIILLLCIVILIYYNSIAYIPLVELIKGNVSNLKQARSDVHFFPGKIWRYNLIFKSVLPFISYYLFASLLMRKSLQSVILFLFSFLLTSFVCLMNFHKGPLGYFLIGLFLVYIIKSQKKIKIRNILIFGVTLLFVMTLTFSIFMGKKIEPKLLLSPFKRVLTGQVGSAYFYLKMFPNDHDFLYERILPNPGGIFPIENYNLSKSVQDYVKPDLRESGKHGSSPAVFWAGIYAGFGMPIAYFVSFLVGVFIFTIHYIVSKGRYTTLKVALIVWIALHYSKISVTSLGKYLIDTDLIAILICCAMIKYGSQFRKIAIAKLL